MTKEELIIKILSKHPQTAPMSKDKMDMLAGKIVGALDLFDDLFSTEEAISLPEQSTHSPVPSSVFGEGVIEIRKRAKPEKKEEAPKNFLEEPRDIDEMFEEFQQEFPTMLELKVLPNKPAMEVTCYVGKLLNSQTYIDKDGKGKSGVTTRIVKKLPGQEDIVLYPERLVFCEENVSAKDVKEEAIKVIREQLARGHKDIPVRVIPAVTSIPDDINKWGSGNAV